MARPGWGLGWGSGIASGGTGCLGRRVPLLFGGELDSVEDVGHFALQGGELKIDDAAAGVENYVYWSVEGSEVVADGLAHAALDAVAVDGLAHYFSDSKANAWTCGVRATQGCAIRAERRTQKEEVRHLLRELFAAGLVDALIVGVFAKTEDDGSGGHTAGLDLMSVESRMTQF
jgi:hypothetical protein